MLVQAIHATSRCQSVIGSSKRFPCCLKMVIGSVLDVPEPAANPFAQCAFNRLHVSAEGGLSLLLIQHFSGADTVLASHSPFASIRHPVKGPMIVIRARPDGMGEKIVSVLKEFLTYTQKQEKPWQQTPTDNLPSWQLFEVIGDFGESDQTELLTKLSSWARRR